MANIDEITDGIQRRLDAVLEEADRLRAAMDALGAETAASIGAPHASRPAGVQGRTNNGRTPPGGEHRERSTIIVTRAPVARADRADGDDVAAPALLSPRDRVLRDLRRELAAGLRNR